MLRQSGLVEGAEDPTPDDDDTSITNISQNLFDYVGPIAVGPERMLGPHSWIATAEEWDQHWVGGVRVPVWKELTCVFTAIEARLGARCSWLRPTVPQDVVDDMRSMSSVSEDGHWQESDSAEVSSRTVRTIYRLTPPSDPQNVPEDASPASSVSESSQGVEAFSAAAVGSTGGTRALKTLKLRKFIADANDKGKSTDHSGK